MPLRDEESPDARYRRYRRALDGERLPAALVDRDALERNVDRVVAAARGKPIRIATKSLRCPTLVRLVAERAGAAVRGLMTYSAAETRSLVEAGARDLILAYPTAHPRDVADLCAANAAGATAAVVVDDVAQLEALAAGARAHGVKLPVLVELDVAYRALGLRVGALRSPLATVDAAVALAERAVASPDLAFRGVMAYEAHVAGLPDASPFSSWQNAPRRWLKALSRRDIAGERRRLVDTLTARGLGPTVVNGGGSGSLAWCAEEDALTEVTVGSAFLGSHLFGYYRDLTVEPAAYFALQVVRRPSPRHATCHGGGYVASGAAGPDRLPLPSLPAGLSLIALEGAGEVQTPLAVPEGLSLAVGDPVFFRHAKAGELAEHFAEYLLVRGDRVVERAPTYRGLGHCFLG